MEENKFIKSKSDSGLAFALLMFFYVCFSLISSITVFVLKIESQTVKSLISSIAVATALICATVISVKIHGGSLKSTVKINGFELKFLLPSILLPFAMLFGLGFVNVKFAEIVKKVGLNVGSADLELYDFKSFVLAVVSHALIPAVFEEVFFRGVLLNGLKNTKKSFAVLTVSVAFALYHCSVTQFFYQFIYGVGLCILMLTSGSIFLPIIAHFLNNFYIVLDSYLGLNTDITKWYVVLIGLVLLAFYVFLTCFLFNKKKQSEEKDFENRTEMFWIPFGLIGGTVCVVLMVLGLI